MTPKTARSIQVFEPQAKNRVRRPLYTTHVPAGFPSTTDEHFDQKLDLNEHLIKHPAATFFVRVSGDSMIEAGIHDGDLLVVDRSIEPKDRQIVVAVVDGEFTVKRLAIKNGRLQLIAANPDYQPISITDASDFQVWGTVTHVIHTTHR